MNQIEFNDIKISQMFTSGKGQVIWMKSQEGRIVCIASPMDLMTGQFETPPGHCFDLKFGNVERFLKNNVFYLVDADYFLGSDCIHRTYSDPEDVM